MGLGNERNITQQYVTYQCHNAYCTVFTISCYSTVDPALCARAARSTALLFISRIESTAPVSCQVCIPSWQLLYTCFCRGAGGYNPGAQMAKIAKMGLSAMALAIFRSWAMFLDFPRKAKGRLRIFLVRLYARFGTFRSYAS